MIFILGYYMLYFVYVIEQIFGLPGIGKFFVQGALNRDYTLVMGVIIFYSVAIIAFNIIVDVLYGLLDPRVPTNVTDSPNSAVSPGLTRGRSLWRTALRRLSHNRAAKASLASLSLIVLLAMLGPLASQNSYNSLRRCGTPAHARRDGRVSGSLHGRSAR